MSPRFPLFWFGVLFAATVATAHADDSIAVHDRIDTLIDAAAIGPLSPSANDFDFVRRVYLDFTGVIPSTDQARAFLENPSPTKRVELVDQLLESPQFARHMAMTFDVVIMERRPDKGVKSADWLAYLQRYFAENRPIDQLLRELIVADGSDDATRPASRFLIDRECEPNLVTRDAGRLLFGMDLQCAQCHDHPSVNAYLQSDYYGLYSFFLRTSSFTDAKKKQTLVAEKAEGEANFKSVFTGNSADRVTPQLPHGPALADEPTFKAGEEYISVPSKTERAVPKHSRRQQLANMLTTSREFRRNLANRLWAHLMGRGLVHPVDGHHLDNPPSHPAVLDLLADHLEKSSYEIKPLLREIALSRAYQRSCEPVAPETVIGTVTAETIAAIERQQAELKLQQTTLDEALRQATAELKVAQQTREQSRTDRLALEKKQQELEAEVQKQTAAEKPAEELLVKVQEQLKVTQEAAAKVAEAGKLLGDDPELKKALDLVNSRSKSIEAEVATAEGKLTELRGKTKQIADALATTRMQYESAIKSQPSPSEVANAEQRMLAARHARDAVHYQIQSSVERLSLAKRILDFEAATLANQSPDERAGIWNELVDRWTIRNQIAPLKSLTSEQFSLSVLEATGMLEHRRQQAQTALLKTPPEPLKQALEADREVTFQQLVDQQVFDQSRANISSFVGLYGTQAGADFQATVNQALFFENGGAVQSLLTPQPANLLDRLRQQSDSSLLADELFLSIYTRLPTEDERQDVVSHLQSREADRLPAISELVWALLSSNEFRFNH